MKYARRRDANEPDVVAALKAAGAAVQKLDGTGCPDLLVGYCGELHLLEIKLPLGARGGKAHRREHEGGEGDMTEAQVKWWAAWKGKAPTIVRSADEALKAIGARR